MKEAVKMSKLVAVKIRGSIDASETIQKTLETLGLTKANKAVVLENNESNKGMLNKAKDYIAYGEVEDDLADEVDEKVNLSPPSGGFKSTKKQYNQGGSLGKRDDMEELLGKML
jgi:large subunit ribosomal protein L30